MGDISEADPKVLHIELCGAIKDLAKSVEIAVARMKLRAECAVVIADTEKVEDAAETLRAVAIEPATPGDTSLVPAALSSDPVDAIYAACTWLTSQAQLVQSKKEAESREESAIAMRILELQERLAGSEK
jgi:CRISPR/Cas system CMR subunit Cmr4 (Cas7 group RAMP superfamily)